MLWKVLSRPKLSTLRAMREFRGSPNRRIVRRGEKSALHSGGDRGQLADGAAADRLAGDRAFNQLSLLDDETAPH